MASGGRWYIQEVSYECGNYMDVEMYPVYRPFHLPPRRKKKHRPTDTVQEKLNQRNAEKSFTRLVHLNFTEDDIALHLTYSDDPKDIRAVRKDVKNFFARIRRRRKNMGLPALKYVYCIERSGSGRAHVHVIMSGGVDRDALERSWGLGFANSKRLQFDALDGVTGLSHYMTKRQGSFKRWVPSRNLERPQPIVRRRSAADLKAAAKSIEWGNWQSYFEGEHEGWELSGKPTLFTNSYTRNEYIYFDMHRAPGRSAAKPPKRAAPKTGRSANAPG